MENQQERNETKERPGPHHLYHQHESTPKPKVKTPKIHQSMKAKDGTEGLQHARKNGSDLNASSSRCPLPEIPALMIHPVVGHAPAESLLQAGKFASGRQEGSLSLCSSKTVNTHGFGARVPTKGWKEFVRSSLYGRGSWIAACWGAERFGTRES